MYAIHLALTLISFFAWCAILARLMYSYVKTKTRNDLVLFVSILLLGGYTVLETIILVCEVPGGLDPGLGELIQSHVLPIYSFVSVGGIFSAILIAITMMRAAAKSVDLNKKCSPFRTAIVYPLYIAMLTSVSLFSSHLLDGIPFIYESYPLVSIPLIIITASMIILSTPGQVFTIMKSLEKTGKTFVKRRDFRNTFMMNCFYLIYLIGVVFRVHFNSSWSLIILGDSIILSALVLGLLNPFMHDFGEALATIMNMRALYIIHFSGRPIFTYISPHAHAPDKQMFSPILVAITQMVEAVVRDNKRVRRLVLTNGIELIIENGDLCIGIIITRKYQPYLKEKLQKMIRMLETNEQETLAQWIGSSQRFSSRVESLMYNVF